MCHNMVEKQQLKEETYKKFAKDEAYKKFAKDEMYKSSHEV